MTALMQVRSKGLLFAKNSLLCSSQLCASSLYQTRRGVVLGSTKRNKSRGAAALPKPVEEVMTSQNGIRYPGPPGTLATARSFVDGWTVPDHILLQAMTHKSFAHGKLPYNEKLAFIGRRILETEAFAVMSTANGSFNLDINSKRASACFSPSTLTAIATSAKLPQGLFYRNGDKVGKDSNKIFASTVEALIGAVYHAEGLERAREFARQRVLASAA